MKSLAISESLYLQPFSPPCRLGADLKVPTLITWLVLLTTSPHPEPVEKLRTSPQHTEDTLQRFRRFYELRARNPGRNQVCASYYPYRSTGSSPGHTRHLARTSAHYTDHNNVTVTMTVGAANVPEALPSTRLLALLTGSSRCLEKGRRCLVTWLRLCSAPL